MPTARSVVAALSLICAALAWPAGSGSSLAAEPGSGSVGPSSPEVAWAGPVVPLSVFEAAGCELPTATCDVFELVVDVDPSYWVDHFGGVSIEIHWEDPSDHFQLVVEDATGSPVASSTRNPPRTDQSVTIPSASGRYRVVVQYYAVTDAGYSGRARFISAEGQAPVRGAGAFFDSADPPSFAPPTLVSAHFLGAEPNVTVERKVAGAPPDATDPDRVYVDWPLSTRLATSQLNRSEDGGDTFRLLFDPSCAQRSRPNCGTGGGGDSFTAVSPWDGTLYFTDQEGTSGGGLAVPLHEAVASSTDHGDTFPAERQWATTNTALVLDRQWLETTDPSKTSVGPRAVAAFLAYHVPGGGQFIQGIDTDGLPIPQPAPQLTIVGQSGPLRVDNTGGPGDGWIYQPFVDAHFEVATAPVDRYQDPSAWQVNMATEDVPEKFPWLDLDDEGNAYAIWVHDGVVYYSSSPIEDPRNDPGAGGRPGSYWSPQLRLSLPSITSSYFAEVAGGSSGRIAIAYVGTDDHDGSAPQAPSTTRWNTYAAVVTNALGEGGAPVVHTGLVTDRVVHVGNIDGTDVSLLDFIDVAATEAGRVAVAFTDNNSTFAGPTSETVRPFALYSEQVSGPSLGEEVVEPTVIPPGARGAALGDSKWPSRADGEQLPALDLLGASLSLTEDEIVARVPLGDSSTERMARDLETFNSHLTTANPAERLLYMMRFSTSEDVYHLSMEFVPGEPPRFFGGRLDDNDRFANVGSGTIVAAGYHTDPAFHVTGTLANDTLVLRMPASEAGVTSGARVFGASAFSTAGPLESDESLLEMMRTVDATPPFDATLVEAAPSPTASPTLLDVNVFAFPEAARRDVGETHELTAIVAGTNGDPVRGAAVEWRSEGTGSISSSDAATDEEGRASAVLGSDAPGEQTVTVAAPGCTGEACTATVSVTWNLTGCDITGTPGADTLVGTTGDDVICALGGDDVVHGGAGDDVLRGGPGSDSLRGRRGDDVLRGASRRDRMAGGAGRDRLYGGAARDRGSGGAGRDVLLGGTGHDSLAGARHADRASGGRGHDLLTGGRGPDRLGGGAGHDRLRGGRGRDRCDPGKTSPPLRC